MEPTATSEDSLTKGHVSETTSANALKGNAAFTCRLIHLVVRMVSMLDEDETAIFNAVTIALVEKAYELNHSEVKTTALDGLEQIARKRGHSNSSNLLLADSVSLFGNLQAKLEKLAIGDIVEAETFCNIAAIIEALLDVATRAQNGLIKLDVTYAIELLTTMTSFFDRNFLHHRQQRRLSLCLLGAYGSASKFMRSSAGFPRKETGQDDSRSRPWFELLHPFRRNVGSGLGETFFRDRLLEEEEEEEEENQERHEEMVTREELHFLNLMSERCDYLLSSEDLTVQRRSCDVKLVVLQFLGELGRAVSVRWLCFRCARWPPVLISFFVLTSEGSQRGVRQR